MTELDLPDVNVLVAVVHPDHVHHRAAQRWFTAVRRFATTPVTESGLLRLALNPAITGGVVDTPAALATLTSLRADDRATFLADDGSLAEPAIDLVGLVGFRQVTDLHLVNLAAIHSAQLVTFDARITSVLTPETQSRVHLLTGA